MQKKKSHHILLGIAAMIGIGGIVASVLMIKNQPIQTNYNYIKKEVEVVNPVYKTKEVVVENEIVRKNLIKDKQYYYDQLKDIVENKIKIDLITQLFLKVDFENDTITDLEDAIDIFNNKFFVIDVPKDSIENVVLKNDTNYFQLFSIYEDFSVKEEFIVNQINLNEYFNNTINATFIDLKNPNTIQQTWIKLLSGRYKSRLQLDIKNTAIFKKSHQRYKEILQWNDATVNAKINDYVNQNFNQPNHNLEYWYRFLMDLQPTNPPIENQPSDTNNTDPNPTPPNSNDTSTSQPDNPQDQPTPIENDPPQPPISNEIVLERNEINTSLDEEINKTIINTPNTNLKEKFISFKNQLQNEPNNDKHKKLLKDIKTFNDTLNEVYTKLNQLKENAQIKKVLDRFNENNNIITLIDGINDNNDIINEVNQIKTDYDTLIDVGVEIKEEIIPNLNDAPELVNSIIENPEVNNTTLFRNKKEENITNPYWFKTNAIFNKYKELYDEMKIIDNNYPSSHQFQIPIFTNMWYWFKDWNNEKERYKIVDSEVGLTLERYENIFNYFNETFIKPLGWNIYEDNYIYDDDIFLQIKNILNEINTNDNIKRYMINTTGLRLYSNDIKSIVYTPLNKNIDRNFYNSYLKPKRDFLYFIKEYYFIKHKKPVLEHLNTSNQWYFDNFSQNLKDDFNLNNYIKEGQVGYYPQPYSNLIFPKQNIDYNKLNFYERFLMDLNEKRFIFELVFKDTSSNDFIKIQSKIQELQQLDLKNLSTDQQNQINNFINTDYHNIKLKYGYKISSYFNYYYFIIRLYGVIYNNYIPSDIRYEPNKLIDVYNTLSSKVVKFYFKLKEKTVDYDEMVEIYSNLTNDLKTFFNNLDETLNDEEVYNFNDFGFFKQLFFKHNNSINNMSDFSNLNLEQKKEVILNEFVKSISDLYFKIVETNTFEENENHISNVNTYKHSRLEFIISNETLINFLKEYNYVYLDKDINKKIIPYNYYSFLRSFNWDKIELLKVLNNDFSTFENKIYDLLKEVISNINLSNINEEVENNFIEFKTLKNLQSRSDSLSKEEIKTFIKYYWLYMYSGTIINNFKLFIQDQNTKIYKSLKILKQQIIDLNINIRDEDREIFDFDINTYEQSQLENYFSTRNFKFKDIRLWYKNIQTYYFLEIKKKLKEYKIEYLNTLDSMSMFVIKDTRFDNIKFNPIASDFNKYASDKQISYEESFRNKMNQLSTPIDMFKIYNYSDNTSNIDYRDDNYRKNVVSIYTWKQEDWVSEPRETRKNYTNIYNHFTRNRTAFYYTIDKSSTYVEDASWKDNVESIRINNITISDWTNNNIKVVLEESQRNRFNPEVDEIQINWKNDQLKTVPFIKIETIKSLRGLIPNHQYVEWLITINEEQFRVFVYQNENSDYYTLFNNENYPSLKTPYIHIKNIDDLQYRHISSFFNNFKLLLEKHKKVNHNNINGLDEIYKKYFNLLGYIDYTQGVHILYNVYNNINDSYLSIFDYQRRIKSKYNEFIEILNNFITNIYDTKQDIDTQLLSILEDAIDLFFNTIIDDIEEYKNQIQSLIDRINQL